MNSTSNRIVINIGEVVSSTAFSSLHYGLPTNENQENATINDHKRSNWGIWRQITVSCKIKSAPLRRRARPNS
jgi:hypothetical protein